MTVGLREAYGQLGSSQKPRAGVSLYSRFVNRPLGRALAAAAATAGIGPNAVTLISAAVTIAGLVLLVALPVTWSTGAIVTALLVLGFALDSADGQVARLTGRGSPAGEWLDHVVDAGKMVLVHTAVLIAASINGLLSGAELLVPLGYALVATLQFSGLTIVDLLRRVHGPPPTAPRSPSTLKAIGLLPADYGVLAAAFLLWGAPRLFLVAYTSLLALTTIITAALLVKWFGELRTLGDAVSQEPVSRR